MTTTTVTTETVRQCPYDGRPVQSVDTSGDWAIFQPCGHPAPPRMQTARDMIVWSLADRRAGRDAH